MFFSNGHPFDQEIIRYRTKPICLWTKDKKGKESLKCCGNVLRLLHSRGGEKCKSGPT